jgi:uncharacterized RDD family membrane protein YckC
MRCEYCLRGERGSGAICPLCGFDGVSRNLSPFLPEGTAVGGRYVLGRQEGHGGFSICYRAWDNVNKEIVAIKELFPREVAERLDGGAVGIEPQFRDDFNTAVISLRHEGEVLRKLTKEPGIVGVGGVFEDNDTAYLSMEYLRGQSYEKYLQDQYLKNQDYLEVEAAVNVALTVLGALDAVHARGLLHLDVKPANIRVLDDGRIVLLDFGSAQHYASGSVTAATDVYGLAATLYYSLSLQVPARADEREQGAVLAALSELNPAVSPALDLIVQEAMALAPEDRYPSMESLRRALGPFGTARHLLPAPPAAPSPLRIVAGLLDIVMIMLLLAALTVGFLMPLELVIVTGASLWGITQLLPLVTKATPGLLVMGLRLTDPNGGAIGLRVLLFRTLMLISAIITLRFRSDAEGLFMHDRVSRSRVVSGVRRHRCAKGVVSSL